MDNINFYLCDSKNHYKFAPQLCNKINIEIKLLGIVN